MKSKPLTTNRLALFNLKRKPLRTAGLIILVSLLTFVLFGGSVLSLSLKNGLDSVKNRLGADLMIVPVGYDESTEGILLKGEPSYFYFEKSVETDINTIEGVEQTTAQFFLTSTNQDCCDIPVQFIGFDPDTDFSIIPWISDVYDGNVNDGDLIIGSDIELKDNSQKLEFFGKEYNVAARLDETGTGLDQAVYANMNTLFDLFEAAKSKGLGFTSDIDPENSISTVLVKIKDGYDTDTVTRNIRSGMDGVQVIKTKSMTVDIAENLDGFVFFIYVFAAMLLILTFITLSVVFSVTVNERKREFGIIRAVGASRMTSAFIILKESLFISVFGGVAGVGLASIVVFPFSTYIGDSLSLPYLQPEIGIIAVIAVICLFVAFVSGPLSAVYSAVKISKAETYLTMKESD